MSAPDATGTCTDITAAPGLRLTLDFMGALMQITSPKDIPNAFDLSRAALTQLSTALGPLQPILTLMNFAIDTLGLAKAIGQALGPPPDPAKLVAAIEKLALDVDQLLGIMPPVSIPKMIYSVLNLLVTYLQGLYSKLSAMAAIERQLQASTIRSQELAALGAVYASEQLTLTTECARAGLLAQLSGIQQGEGSLGEVICLLNKLSDTLSLPEIPGIGISDTTSITNNLAPIQAAILALGTIRDALNVTPSPAC